MATTSLWHIKGRLKDLISYVENPEKTVPKEKDLQDFFNVFSYVQRPEATENGEYVSAINCLKEVALQQVILTKKQYGKEDKYIAWHGYQSFKPGEVTPEQAHEIGMQTAREMWGDRYQIIVTTHLDKDHLHNHFCFNSVSFLDGGKYNYSKKEQQRLRNVSDRICMEHGLSVIKNPHKAALRSVWLDEKSGSPTRYNVYREDVQALRQHRRRPTKSGIVSPFSGLLYCADCGEKLYYSVTNNYKREQAYFFCSAYRKNSDVCSAHYIREKVVAANVLESMRRVFLNVQVFEKEFVRKQMECYDEDKRKELSLKRRELNKAKKRIAEIDGLIQKLYEDNAKGKVSDERYATLSMSYEEEQRELKVSLPEMEAYLETETDKTENLHRFVEKVKKITEIKELTPELVHEFIDKIVVYAPKKLDGKRVQLMDIYYNGVGILRELSPEEREKAFQEHLAERERTKAKTA